MSKTIIIIGAMKAGSTSLHSILAQHPAICPGRRKELDYFSKTHREGRPYESCFPKLDPARHTHTLDSSTSYAKRRNTDVPAQIAGYDRDARLIYLLRNPLDRMVSHFRHSIAKGRLTTLGKRQAHQLFEVSCYVHHLRNYERHGLGGNILLMDFDALVATPGEVTDAACDFIGVPRFVPQDLTPKNQSPIPRPEIPEILLAYRDKLARQARILVMDYGFEPAARWFD